MISIIFIASAALAEPITPGHVRTCVAEARLAPFAQGSAHILRHLGEDAWRATENKPLSLRAAAGYEYTLKTVERANLEPEAVVIGYSMPTPGRPRRGRINAWARRLAVKIDGVFSRVGDLAPRVYEGHGRANFVFEGGALISPLKVYDFGTPVPRLGRGDGLSVHFGVGKILPLFFDMMKRTGPAVADSQWRVAVTASLDPTLARTPSARDARVFEALVEELTSAWPYVAFDVTLLVPSAHHGDGEHVHVFNVSRPIQHDIRGVTGLWTEAPPVTATAVD